VEATVSPSPCWVAAQPTLQYLAQGASREIRNQFLRERTAEEARESMGCLYDGIEIV
jgi:hypothetical protein